MENESRRGKARERQRRRKERLQPGSKPIPRKSSAAQLAPAGGFKLPEIDVRFLRPVLLAIGALIFMGVVIVAVGLFKNDPVEADPNALWVGDSWTYQTHTDEEMNDFVAQLREYRIGTVYARVSDLNFDGSWTGRPDMQNQFEEVRPEVTRFAQQFRAAYPDAQLYGVIGVQADLAADGYRLDDERTQRVIADFSAQVVGSLGFDGVMVNVDPVWNGDDNYLSLLRRVRQTIGTEPLMAVATPPDWTPVDVDVPTPAVIAPGTVWDAEYKQRVALIQPNQIVVRSYNSYLDNANDYTAWMAYQVQAYAEAIAPLQTDTILMIGIPTYDDSLPAHDVTVETVAAAVDGVRRGVAALDEETAPIIEGIAIYADWTTDQVEWDQFKRAWVNR